MNFKIKPLILALALIPITSIACPEVDERYEPKSKEIINLCRSEYELGYSKSQKIALWAGEYLTVKELDQSEERISQFKADPFLNSNERAELSDYLNSGYDRGHLVPAKDMVTMEGMLESFYLSNMVPQVPSHNRGIWKSLERYARILAHQRNGMIIFTGPIIGKAPLKMNGRIIVPRAMFKILFDPKTLDVWTFIIPNESNITSSMLPKYIKSLNDIKKETGLNFLNKIKVNEQSLLEQI